MLKIMASTTNSVAKLIIISHFSNGFFLKHDRKIPIMPVGRGSQGTNRGIAGYKLEDNSE